MFHTTFSGLFSIAPPPDKRLKGLIRKSRDKQTQLDTYVWDTGATTVHCRRGMGDWDNSIH